MLEYREEINYHDESMWARNCETNCKTIHIYFDDLCFDYFLKLWFFLTFSCYWIEVVYHLTVAAGIFGSYWDEKRSTLDACPVSNQRPLFSQDFLKFNIGENLICYNQLLLCDTSPSLRSPLRCRGDSTTSYTYCSNKPDIKSHLF